MAGRRLIPNIPIWVRVSGFIALVLAGVVVSSMLLGGNVSGGRDHGIQTERTDHNGGQTGPAAPSRSEPSENPAPSSHQTPPKEGGPLHSPDDSTSTPRPGDHTRSDGRRDH